MDVTDVDRCEGDRRRALSAACAMDSFAFLDRPSFRRAKQQARARGSFPSRLDWLDFPRRTRKFPEPLVTPLLADERFPFFLSGCESLLVVARKLRHGAVSTRDARRMYFPDKSGTFYRAAQLDNGKFTRYRNLALSYLAGPSGWLRLRHVVVEKFNTMPASVEVGQRIQHRRAGAANTIARWESRVVGSRGHPSRILLPRAESDVRPCAIRLGD